MILVTVGMQLGFDRLVRAMDEIAVDLNDQIIAQVGPGQYMPKNFEARSTIPPNEFERLVAQADMIVSHAGIGSVLTARRHRKPIVLFARSAALGEHRNDHQLATVNQLRGRPGILVADDRATLLDAIQKSLSSNPADYQVSESSDELQNAVIRFVAHGHVEDRGH